MGPGPSIVEHGLIAHRGLHSAADDAYLIDDRLLVENSPLAISAAIARNLGIEVDIQPCADGGWVVFHDPDLKRLFGMEASLISMNLHQLERLNYPAGNGRPISLQYLLAQVGSTVPLYVEIKADVLPTDNHIERLVSVAQASPANVAWMSFSLTFLERLAAKCPQLHLGVLFEAGAIESKRAKRQLDRVAAINAQFLGLDIRTEDQALCELVKRWSGKLLCWTVNSKAKAYKAQRLGAKLVFEGNWWHGVR